MNARGVLPMPLFMAVSLLAALAWGFSSPVSIPEAQEGADPPASTGALWTDTDDGITYYYNPVDSLWLEVSPTEMDFGRSGASAASQFLRYGGGLTADTSGTANEYAVGPHFAEACLVKDLRFQTSGTPLGGTACTLTVFESVGSGTTVNQLWQWTGSVPGRFSFPDTSFSTTADAVLAVKMDCAGAGNPDLFMKVYRKVSP